MGFVLSCFPVQGIAAAAVDMDLTLAAGHAQVLLAAGTLEEHVVLLTASILGGLPLLLLFAQHLKPEIVLHFTLAEISGKGADKGSYKHKAAKEENKGA